MCFSAAFAQGYSRRSFCRTPGRNGYKNISELTYVNPGNILVLVFSQYKDVLHEQKQSSYDLYDAVTASGVPAELNMIEGAEHGRPSVLFFYGIRRHGKSELSRTGTNSDLFDE